MQTRQKSRDEGFVHGQDPSNVSHLTKIRTTIQSDAGADCSSPRRFNGSYPEEGYEMPIYRGKQQTLEDIVKAVEMVESGWRNSPVKSETLQPQQQPFSNATNNVQGTEAQQHAQGKLPHEFSVPRAKRTKRSSSGSTYSEERRMRALAEGAANMQAMMNSQGPSSHLTRQGSMQPVSEDGEAYHEHPTQLGKRSHSNAPGAESEDMQEDEAAAAAAEQEAARTQERTAGRSKRAAAQKAGRVWRDAMAITGERLANAEGNAENTSQQQQQPHNSNQVEVPPVSAGGSGKAMGRSVSNTMLAVPPQNYPLSPSGHTSTGAVPPGPPEAVYTPAQLDMWMDGSVRMGTIETGELLRATTLLKGKVENMTQAVKIDLNNILFQAAKDGIKLDIPEVLLSLIESNAPNTNKKNNNNGPRRGTGEDDQDVDMRDAEDHKQQRKVEQDAENDKRRGAMPRPAGVPVPGGYVMMHHPGGGGAMPFASPPPAVGSMSQQGQVPVPPGSVPVPPPGAPIMQPGAVMMSAPLSVGGYMGVPVGVSQPPGNYMSGGLRLTPAPMHGYGPMPMGPPGMYPMPMHPMMMPPHGATPPGHVLMTGPPQPGLMQVQPVATKQDVVVDQQPRTASAESEDRSRAQSEKKAVPADEQSMPQHEGAAAQQGADVVAMPDPNVVAMPSQQHQVAVGEMRSPKHDQEQRVLDLHHSVNTGRQHSAEETTQQAANVTPSGTSPELQQDGEADAGRAVSSSEAPEGEVQQYEQAAKVVDQGAPGAGNQQQQQGDVVVMGLVPGQVPSSGPIVVTPVHGAQPSNQSLMMSPTAHGHGHSAHQPKTLSLAPAGNVHHPHQPGPHPHSGAMMMAPHPHHAHHHPPPGAMVMAAPPHMPMHMMGPPGMVAQPWPVMYGAPQQYPGAMMMTASGPVQANPMTMAMAMPGHGHGHSGMHQHGPPGGMMVMMPAPGAGMNNRSMGSDNGAAQGGMYGAAPPVSPPTTVSNLSGGKAPSAHGDTVVMLKLGQPMGTAGVKQVDGPAMHAVSAQHTHVA